jgi:hypothetical protein
MRIALWNIASTIPATCKDSFSELSCTWVEEIQSADQHPFIF